MDKKTAIAIALSFVVLVIWQFFFVKPMKPVSPTEGHTPVTRVEEPATTTAAPIGGENKPVVTPIETTAAPTEGTKPRDITIKTPLYTAMINTDGGRIKSFSLTNYKATIKEDSLPVDLITEDMVNLSPEVTFDTPVGSFSDTVVYTTDGPDTITVDGTEKKALVLTWVGKQFKVEKTFTFNPKTYAMDLTVIITNLAGQEVTGDLNVSLYDFVDVKKKSWSIFGSYDYPTNYLVFTDGKLKKSAAKGVKIDKQVDISGAVSWFGFDSKYFIMSLITKDFPGATMEIVRKSDTLISGSCRTTGIVFPTQTPIKKSIVIYYGPKDAEPMDAVGYSLSSSIDYGFFSFLCIPMIWMMNFFYGIFKNYGIAIILLTVVVRIILFPFTYKSMKSMKEMQKVQPLMMELREKYKNDKEKLNQEVMRLYQTHKINPLGGCLPILLQLPVFIALYKTLFVSIQLRHSPFIFWIKDLAAMDPYYVTPIVMGISYFAQQKLTPSSLDPMQQKIMLMMPIIFTVIFINLPAGLVLYFFVSNLLSIAQQLYMNKFVKD